MQGIKKEANHARHLRNAFGRFATGVTVVTARSSDGKLAGLTANSFSALSLDPPLVLWSLRRKAWSLAGFLAAKHFAVNVLAADQTALSRHFATPQPDKFAKVSYRKGLGGCAVIEGALAVFECTLHNTVDGGDHMILVGRVERATYQDGLPLIFNAGQYCTLSPLVEF